MLLRAADAFFREAGKKEPVSLAFVTDREMKKWNTLYRGKRKTTDVLSFRDRDSKDRAPGESGGEILISYAQAEKQAKEKGHSVSREVVILFVHGLAHLYGYTHDREKDAKEMENLEKKVLGL